ncbi:MAG: ferredoxin--NADP reductase [Rhizobiaceae bacterium]|nr:ferredoxin--NADP reductase [Rhizobiaceae bacterium]
MSEAAQTLAPDSIDAPASEFPIPAGVFAEKVVSVQHYTDRLFRFRITRPQSFRFRSGEFVMIGLPNAAKPVYRAYSVASPSWDEELEFYSIKVQDGPLTQHLQKIKPGDTVLMRPKPTGTLVHDALTPGKRVWMIATGTGIAPFASLIRDPETYEKFDEIVLTNTCRDVAELAYGNELVAALRDDPLIGELVETRLKYVAATTRETSPLMGRITTRIEDGSLFAGLGVEPFNPDVDRVMICGSMDMLRDVKALVEKAGLVEGSVSNPGQFVVERAFVG